MLKLLQTFLQKLRLIDDEYQVDLEAAIVYLFIAICAFRSLFASVTLTFHDIKWTIPDMSAATSLPVLFSMLSNSHRRVLDSKDTTLITNLKGTSNDESGDQN